MLVAIIAAFGLFGAMSPSGVSQDPVPILDLDTAGLEDLEAATLDAIDRTFGELSSGADDIRSDDTLNDRGKDRRIESLIQARQVELDEYRKTLRTVLQHLALKDGRTLTEADAEADLGVEIVFNVKSEALRTGQSVFPDDGETEEPVSVDDQEQTDEASLALLDIFVQLEPAAAQIRSDKTLSDNVRHKQIEALVATRQAEIDQNLAALWIIKVDAALESGVAEDQAGLQAEAVTRLMLETLRTRLETGEDISLEMADNDEPILPEFAALERAGADIEAILEALEPKAAAIRSDEGLSAEARQTQLQALLTPHQDAIDAFQDAMVEAVHFQLLAEGETERDAESGAEAMGQHVLSQMLQNFMLGRMIDDLTPEP